MKLDGVALLRNGGLGNFFQLEFSGEAYNITKDFFYMFETSLIVQRLCILLELHYYTFVIRIAI